MSEVFLGNGGDGVRPDFGRFRQSGLARSQLQTRAPTECRSDGNDDNRRGTRMMVLSVRRNNDHVTQALVGGLDRQFNHPDFALTRFWKSRNYGGCHLRSAHFWRGVGYGFVSLGFDKCGEPCRTELPKPHLPSSQPRAVRHKMPKCRSSVALVPRRGGQTQSCVP